MVGSFFSALTWKLIGGAAAVALFFMAVHWYNESIRQEAIQRQLIQQQQEILDYNRDQAERLKRIDDFARSIEAANQRRAQEEAERFRRIEESIERSPDTPASQLFRDVIKQLGGR